MNKISVASILSLPEDKIVGQIYTCDTKKKQTIRNDVDDIINKNKERRENKLKLYREMLRKCIDSMKKNNEMRKTDIFFRVDEIVYGHPEYDIDECVEYIILELRKFSFDVLHYCRDTVFVSWKFVELHKHSQFLTNPNNCIQ